jgi:hypothetical protein
MSEYRAAPQVSWAVEAGGVLLIDRATGAAVALGYPQAAVWDFLTRGESEERICAMLCAIASLQPEAARTLLLETAAALREAGFLEPRPAGG